VATRRWILLLVSATVTSVLAGCGNNGAVQNPPPPPQSSVSIAFQPAPPASVFLNVTVPVTAVVSDDSSNAGVDWALTCQKGSNCGTLTPLHTDSGKAATYTPPPTITGNIESVNILAFATADHTKNILGSIAVTGFGSTLKGTYVFQTQGVDANGAYQLAGVVVLDGNAAVTSGEQTRCDIVQCLSDPIMAGSYTVGPDGRGTLTLNTGDPNLGQQGSDPGQVGIENFSLVALSSSQVLIAILDDPNLSGSNEAAAGTMDLQSSPTAPTGGYAFSLSGTDVATASPVAWGGVLRIDSPKTISGAGSLVDQDLAGTLTNCPAPAFSGTVSDPDSFGKVVFDLTFDPTTCFVSTPSVEFTGYLVDAVHIKLVESDNNGSGTGGAAAGSALSQGTSTGKFTSNSAFAGKYVFGILGEDLSGLPTSLASAGRFLAANNGTIGSGFSDKFMGGLFVEASGPLTGTYTLDSTGTGRVDSFIVFNDPTKPGAELIFYLTGNGNPPLMLDAEGDANFGPLGVGTGLAYPQAAPPYAFNGKYGLNFTESSGVGTGQMTVASTATPPLSGIVDTNLFFSPNPNSILTGTFGAIPNNGHVAGTLSNTFYLQSPNATISGTYYLADSNHGFFIETDTFSVFLTYFATRMPICQGCP
jgi:hypothetical protein